MTTVAGRRLRRCDKQAVTRKTVSMTAAQMGVLAASRRNAKSLAASMASTLDAKINEINPHYGAQVADLVRHYVRTKASLIINFPLDITDSLCEDPFLRNQLETGTSKGRHVEPIRGGARDRWEAKAFAGGCHSGSSEEVNAAERPRYGSISVDKSQRGVIQYGGGVFELADHVRSRVTIAHDGVARVQPFHVGTLAYADHVLCLLGKERREPIFQIADRGRTRCASG